jgi:hypothetical protein
MRNMFATFHVLPGKTAEFECLHRQLLASMCADQRCGAIAC